MKPKIFIISIFILLASSSFSQLKYEGNVKSIYKAMQLDDGSFKYIKYSKNNKEVLIFNIDNSLWRTVKLPLPENHILDEIKHISIQTFNKDDYVELAYSCVVYNISDNETDQKGKTLNIEFTLNIISESGESILHIPNSSEMEIKESNGKNSLFIYKHVGEHFGDQDVTLIYSF